VGSTATIAPDRVGEADGAELFTGPSAAAGMLGNTLQLLHSVKEINQFGAIIKDFNDLIYCIKFNQTSQNQSETAIWLGLPRLLNRVIHKFRGHPDSVWQLNQLTTE
jgi:hypothetical protein